MPGLLRLMPLPEEYKVNRFLEGFSWLTALQPAVRS